MSIGKMTEFDIKSGMWSSYIERLEMFFKVNGVKSGLQLPTLIAVMGDEAYELLVNLASPQKPSSLTYVDAKELLSKHLQPAPSVLAERYRFRQRKQGAEETIADYVAELKKAARHCMFESSFSVNLRDQFVCGVKNDIIRQRLFAEDDTLTFVNAVKLATALEAAERDAAAVDGGAGSAGFSGAAEVGPVHAISAGRGRRSYADEQRVQRGTRVTTRGGVADRRPSQPMSGSSSGGSCRGCGSTIHGYEACRFKNYECSRCRCTGHLRRVCPEREMEKPRAQAGRADVHFGDGEDAGERQEAHNIEDFHHLCLNDYQPVSLPISINNKIINMEVDTGTAVSCIGSDTYHKYFGDVKLEQSSIDLRFYDGSTLKPLGLMKPKVVFGKIQKKLELFVIDGGTTSLIGRQWLAELHIGIPNFANCHSLNKESEQIKNQIAMLCDRYKELFAGGLGRYTGGKATLRLRAGATPVFHRARPLPYALRERVDAELEAMLRDGIIEPVDCSEWASPLVPVNKPDGSLRICADYKATVNPALLVDRYPLPKIDDLIVRLGESRYFSKIDLSQAYNQIELDDSKTCTVINTHRGLFRYNRLVFGLASSPGIFQRIMCTVLSGIPNVEVFLDDVVIGGKTVVEHLKALETVFNRLHQKGLKLKASKCVFLVNEIKYLGYVLSTDGIKTDPDKIEAITKIPRPNNVTELRSFLGMINFYAKFVRQMSGRLVPLYDLLKKDVEWRWSNECERAFKDIKQLLTSTEVLAYYDPDQPLILTCDASARGVGGVLLQPDRNGGGERPVAYVSRTLNDAEKHYSQIHREALAIIFCVNKFHQYLYGRQFTLRTDHKPLVSIFGPHSGIPAMAASRMQRWALILAAYTFDIEYVRTNENVADGLSRLPVTGNTILERTAPEQTYLHFIQQALLLDYNEVCKQTTRDPLLGRVLSYVRDGWPTECEISELQPYFNRKNELYEELGCIMWGHRLVIPSLCRERVLRMLHEPHMGIVRSKALARSYVWWPGVDEAVERMCRECAVCAAQADAPPRQAPAMWPWPDRQWTRIHLDFMGPILGKSYLVVIDAMSKWVEVFYMPSTTAGAVILTLCELFSRWGLPKQIVSDNGPPFSSTELRNFNQYLGIEHIFSAPYHPASNGLAEVTVKALKRVIKKAIDGKQDINKALWTYLLYYRNTVHPTTGQSPAMLLQGRRLRTRLDVLKPDREATVHRAQQRQAQAAGGAHRELGANDNVWYRLYLKGEKWAPGQIIDRIGSGDYRVRGTDGSVIHRHIEQLKRRSGEEVSTVPRTSLMSAPGIVLCNGGVNESRETSPVDVQGGSTEQSTEQPVPQQAGQPGSAGATAPEPGPSNVAVAPGSPVGQVVQPRVLTPPQARPVRRCRLKGCLPS